MLIIVVLGVLPLMAVIAALVVDVALWRSEQGGAQKDADLSALAGALSLLDPSADAAANATSAAGANADANNATGNARSEIIHVGAGCFDVTATPASGETGGATCCPNAQEAAGTNNGVHTVIRHDSPGMFMRLWGTAGVSVHGESKACAGSVSAASGLTSLEVDASGDDPCMKDGAFVFDQLCGLDFGDDKANHPRALALLSDASPGDPRDQLCSSRTDSSTKIQTDATGRCTITPSDGCDTKAKEWQDCVALQDADSETVLSGLNLRLSNMDSTCGDTFADAATLVFENTDDEAKSVYEANDCAGASGVQAAPRLVTIVVLQKAPPKQVRDERRGNAIAGFAAFYIVGCSTTTGITSESDPELDPNCVPTAMLTATSTPVGAATATPTATLAPGETPVPPPGAHEIVYGRFVNLIVPNAEIGDFNASTTLSGTALVQ